MQIKIDYSSKDPGIELKTRCTLSLKFNDAIFTDLK